VSNASNADLSRLPVPGDGTGTARLRAALREAGFTADGLLELLGAPAYAALARGETVPALRATRPGAGDDGPLAALTRLFLLRRPVPRSQARAALPDAAFDAALGDGWLRAEGDDVRATVEVRPYAGEGGLDWWVVSDPRPAFRAGEPRRPDVVLGVGGASATLAQLTVRRPVRRVLDLGTGCGVQALHASQHAERVTATDVNPRALRMTALTLALSGAPEADLREGSLYEPVTGESGPEKFDLIVANPPFVISPHGTAAGERLTYRDAGLPGDEVCRALVGGAASHLAEGGWCQLLANWEEPEGPEGEGWRERLASWVPEGCDAWIVRREEQDVTEYTELWLRDAGAHLGDPQTYEKQYEEWLADFAARRTRTIGLGWITLRRTAAARRAPAITVEEWPHAVEQPLGETIPGHFARQDFLRDQPEDAALLGRRLALADGVVQEQFGEPGAEHPQQIVLRQRHGMMRARAVDTVTAGVAGACDGTLPLGAIADAVADLLGEDQATIRAQVAPEARTLVEQGFLLPA
jgi:methylase of polypeptide subunit release factors